jgi:hypothetical protein
MCEDHTYTDLHLVAGDGQIFAAHQIIVGSCSALIKEESENPKIAENLTVYLPDFSPGAIKSLLCLMYTGSSGDECSPRELRQLLLALRVELRVDSGNNVSLAPLTSSSSSTSSRKLGGIINGYDDRINTNNSSFGQQSLLRTKNKSTPISSGSNRRNLLNNLMNNAGNNDDTGVDLFFVRSKDCCPNEELFVFILSSYPFAIPPSFREEEEEEGEVNGAKDTLLPESTISSILRANNNCLSSLGLHSSPLDPVYIKQSRLLMAPGEKSGKYTVKFSAIFGFSDSSLIRALQLPTII